MPLSLIGIAAHLLWFYTLLQLVSHMFAQRFERLYQRGEVSDVGRPRYSLDKASKILLHGRPVAGQFFEHHVYQLGDVSAAERQPLAQPLQLDPVGLSLRSEPLYFAGAAGAVRAKKPYAVPIAPSRDLRA